MHESRTISEYVSEATFAELPDRIRHKAKSVILDQLGCQIGNATLPWSTCILTGVNQLGSSGPSVVVAFGDRLSPDEAAFVNGSFGAGNEIDDAHLAFRTHPGAVIVPAVLAAAQAAERTNGADILLATVMGYETMIRVAWAGLPTLMEYRHHHTPVATGPFGAAMAVSKLLGFDQEHTLNSLAIAGSHSGGLMEYTQSGGSVKRIHTGMAAKAGIRSAYFARAGLTGPHAVLEGNRGFLEGFADRNNVGRLVEALGEDYLIEGVGLKKYFAMYRIHPPLRAMERVLADHAVEFSDITGIRVGVSSVTVTAVGTIVEPDDALGAQFSMRFALALAAKRGAGVLQLVDDDMLHDPEVIALAHRIEVYVDPRLEERKWSSFATVLTLSTSQGATFVAEEEAPIGSPDNPMSDAEIEEKFRSLAEPVIGSSQCDHIIKAIWDLENIDVEADLMRHVTRAAGS